MIILDTNVISELLLRVPDPVVTAWANRQAKDQLVTTAITAMELQAGVEKLLQSHRRTRLEVDISWALDDLLGGRVLNFDRKAASAAAAWHAHCRRMGRTVPTTDTQIAGIAISRRIPIATRDIRDFEDIDVKLINPWAEAV